MARIFVASDDLQVRIEIDDLALEAAYSAVCESCGQDVLADARERFHFEDAMQVAEIHADRCQP